MKHYHLLINLSGGLDSTYTTWEWLKNNPNKRLLLHYCKLQNYQNRSLLEATAVMNIVEWFHRNGFNNFDIIHTSIDLVSLGQGLNDIEVIGFMNAALLRANRYKVDEIAITASAQDYTQPTYSIRAESRFKLIELLAKYAPKYIFPIKEKTRRIMIERIPKDLMSLVWFCRAPKVDVPCGVCKTCRWTIPYLKMKGL